MAKVTVVGSINIDTVLSCDRFPTTEASSYASDISHVPGGKGANQAVALARLGSDVSLIGCVGDDENGRRAVENLRRNGVDTVGVTTLGDAPTGTTFIHVVNGRNAITKLEGANAAFSPAQLERHTDLLMQADMVLMQFSIPTEVIAYTAAFCHSHQKTLIVNPAPAKQVPRAVAEAASYLTPNQHEFASLTGIEDTYAAVTAYPNKLIITLGKHGVLFHDGNAPVLLPPYEHGVRLDATGAGDCFNGALCHFLSRGVSLSRAIEYANICAGISVTDVGAQTGMPYAHQIRALTENP